jgi:transglutaminase-like putative cysteine protease
MPIIGIDLGTSNSAAAALRGGRPVLDGAIDFMYRIKPDMVYDTGATTVINTPPMSFALRRGVCQDFAHIMFSGLRGIGLPSA